MGDFPHVGKGEITVRSEAFPGTYIQIGFKLLTWTKKTNGTFRIEFGELNI